MENGASSYRRFRDTGDEGALTEIIRQYRDGLIFYLFSFVGDLHTAEELAEDTFVRLYFKKPRDKAEASFKTWLYTIGRNLAINHLRKAARHPEITCEELPEIGEEFSALEQSYFKQEQKIALHKAMQKLKPEYRQILWLIYFEGFSHKEAAKIMKKSVHNIEVLVSRARKSLKSQLEMEGFIYEEL